MDSFKKDQQIKHDDEERVNSDWRAKRDAELAAKNPPIEGGTTNVNAPSLSAAAQERRIQAEGQEHLGRNPEEIFAGKRQDWDPKKG